MKCVRYLQPIIFIFLLALILRILYNISVAHNYFPKYDSIQYWHLGLNLVSMHIFGQDQVPPLSTVNRAPFWPLLLGLLSLFVSHDFAGQGNFFVRIFLCCLDAGTCVIIYLFVRDLFSTQAAIIAGVLAACYPGLYVYTGWLYSETLYTFLLLTFCYILFRLQSTPHKNLVGKLVTGGVVLGLLSLTRPNGLLVLGLFLSWLIIMGWQKIFSWRQAVISACTISLITVALVAPWTIRNAVVSHSFLPIATGDGTVLLGSYNDVIITKPFDEVTWLNPKESNPQLAQSFQIGHCDAVCEVKREVTFKDAALQWIKTHPGDMPYLLTAHFVNMWLPVVREADLPTIRFPGQSSSQAVTSMMYIFSLPIFLLAAVGLLIFRRRWRELLFFYFIMALTIGQCLVFYGSARFRAPIEPILIVMATGTIWWLSRLRQSIACDKIETTRPGSSKNVL